MKSYKINEVTLNELIQWRNNPAINPRTSREISNTGNVYKYLEKEYRRKIKVKYSIDDTVDDKDPISLKTFWEIENNVKKIIYTDLEQLIFYKDSNGLIRCFEKESLEYMKAYNINKHPITGQEIPIEVFNNIEAKKIVNDKTINDTAFDVFQKFSKISLFIDHELFMNLEKNELLKFNYELKDFYLKNFSSKQKKDICNFPLLEKTSTDLDPMSKDEIITYLLKEMNILLNVENEDLIYMINSVLLGALQLVIPKIKEDYSDTLFFEF